MNSEVTEDEVFLRELDAAATEMSSEEAIQFKHKMLRLRSVVKEDSIAEFAAIETDSYATNESMIFSGNRSLKQAKHRSCDPMFVLDSNLSPKDQTNECMKHITVCHQLIESLQFSTEDVKKQLEVAETLLMAKQQACEQLTTELTTKSLTIASLDAQISSLKSQLESTPHESVQTQRRPNSDYLTDDLLKIRQDQIGLKQESSSYPENNENFMSTMYNLTLDVARLKELIVKKDTHIQVLENTEISLRKELETFHQEKNSLRSFEPKIVADLNLHSENLLIDLKIQDTENNTDDISGVRQQFIRNNPPPSILVSSPRSYPEKHVHFDPLTVLLDAAMDGDQILVETCLDGQVNVDSSNDEGLTALHNGACNGHLHIVSLLLARNANVNAVDDDGWTPLHGAASFGEASVADMLIKNGANIDAINGDGQKPLQLAVDDDTRQLLLDAHARKTKLNIVYALYDYFSQSDDALSFKRGDTIEVLGEAKKNGWKRGKHNHVVGFFPWHLVGEYSPVRSTYHEFQDSNV